MFLIVNYLNVILNMENAEIEENSTTNPKNNPSSFHYSRVVYIVYTIC